MKPLRRRPKQLDEEPTVYRPSSGSGRALVLVDAERTRGRAGPAELPDSPTSGDTGETGEVIALEEFDESAADLLTRRRSHDIARRLALAPPPRDRRARRGVGDLTSVRWWGGSSEMDLDATVRAIAGKPFPEDDDIVVRERVRARRSVVLAIDVSGSMKGERIRTAAAAVGALTGALQRDRLAVIAFWSDAAVLSPLGRRLDPNAMLDLLLRVPARGLTNVAFALQVCRKELGNTPFREGRVLLLSDCVHNAGPDPRTIATTLPRLDVLLDVSGEKDPDLGRDLAHLGRGKCRTIRSYRDVPDALRSVFTV
ncbi:vWA domain-containing protein [Rhodococcus chondri]|uniref:VWA domain-containing protein n=1 Tax=Rhodococcus chondri TaxID=3065941 RepID=A0ABU7JZA3_9NOCA|nr:VWA domain-containing protein [Rhodococcus sp. CC-R104]MEE2035327.1 VWA domain-containing protein [Rhodococcus sp. CC-R104]